MMKSISLSGLSLNILGLALLVGCGGGSTPANTSPPTSTPPPASVSLNTEFYGICSAADLIFVAVTKDTVTTFIFDSDEGCHEAGLFQVDASTATTLTLLETISLDPTPACEVNNGVNSITAELALAWLPPQAIDGWQDGPWNCSSALHRDRAPDVGLTPANFNAAGLITDGHSDLTVGESQWVDIQSLKLTFN
jgi:hypothetical protein